MPFFASRKGDQLSLKSSWLQRVDLRRRPVYSAIVDALAEAVRAGDLQSGDRVPPQRVVAETLGVDMTTVTRAYGVARDRGLTEGAVGRGTFISARALDDDAGLIDLSMNLPPPPAGLSLPNLLLEATARTLQRRDATRLMSYHPGAGTAGQRAAGAAWLEPCLGSISSDRVLVSSGAQTIIAAVLAAVAPPGSTVVVEPFTYPGLIALAARMGVTLAPCLTDAEGMRPDVLDRICRERTPAAIYLVPTMQNPTASTMPTQRRRDIAELASRYDLQIIEDDAYGRLVENAPPALATFAPERTHYISTLSKCLSPGLRMAYLVCPIGASVDKVAADIRTLSLMPSALMASVVTSWIRDGTALSILRGIQTEAAARREIALRILPQAKAAERNSIHLWLDLPAPLSARDLWSAARERGFSLVTAENFAVGEANQNAVRISLGGAESQGLLAEGLNAISDLIGRPRAADQIFA